MKKALIDTNIISAFMRGNPSVIQKTEKYLHFHKHGWGMEDPRGQNPKRWMIRRVLAGFVKEFTCVSRQMVPWLEADIRFTGNRLDVPDLLRQLDLFVLPSLNEGISNTILEAMATGVPVIASRTGGNPELVTDGETGALFTPGDQAELAGLLEKFLKDDQLRQITGKKARESIIQRFSMANMAAGYTDVWRRAAGKKSV